MDKLDYYKRAINDIDDYFEYRNESEVDKAIVMCIIDTLTKNLQELDNGRNG